MKKFKNAVQICFLFILLSVLAVLPILVTYIQNKNLINQVYISDIKVDETALKTLKIENKLNVIANSSSAIVKDNKSLKQSDAKVINDVVKQLELLEESNVIPLIDFSTGRRIEKELKTTYLNMDNYKSIINIKEFVIAVQNYSIYVSIDMDTSVVYKLTLIAREGELPQYKTIFCPTSYIHYLGLPLKNILIDGDNSKGWFIYKDENSHFLYVYCRNERYLSFELGAAEDKKDSKIKAITSNADSTLN